MTFLAPLALFGTLLLIIPIVVHLFKPRKMRQTPFSSLRWLKQTHQRLSRRIQWHQWLLFLVRAGCILLLVLALAKPLIGNWGEKQTTDRFIILDTSRSMACQVQDTPAPGERAVNLAADIAERARPGERTSLVLAGAPPRLLAAPSADASRSLAKVKAVKPGLAETNLTAALPLVRSLLPRQGDRDVELVFLTDNLKQRWQHGEVREFLKDLSRPVHVKIIDVGLGSVHNAWIANARLFQFGAGEDRWIRVEVGYFGDTQLARSVRLTGIAGVADDVQPLTLKPGQITRADFKIPAAVALQGQVAELRLEPADALPSDDVYFLNLDTAWALRVLLVEPETAASDDRSAGLFLRTGMEALAVATNQSLEVANRTSGNVTAGDFRKADVILLAGVPELPDAALESLETRVRAGAGLALFLGPQIQRAFYNQKLYRPQQPAEGLLPLPLRGGAEGPFTEGKPGTLTNLRWTHPLLTSLHDPVLSDLTQSRFRIYGALEGTAGKNDTVVGRFDDDMPAIVERPVGAGRVLFFNTSANDDWSDLPRRKSFVPLIDRTLAYLAAASVKRTFTAGDAVTLPLPDSQAAAEVTVVTPSGAKLTPQVMTIRGQRLVHLGNVSEAGEYRVEGATKKTLVFVVNAGRSDSPLSAMDAKTLEDWWAPASVEIVNAETAAKRLEQQSSRWPLWPGLVALAGLLLLIETVYVHRLCPRAHPKTAETVVTQRGMMRPIGT